MTTTTPRTGNLPPVSSQRGRPSDYTPEEDAIILRHRNTDDVLRLLAEAGFPERTKAAIWSRRKYLNETGASEATAALLEGAAHELIPVLSAKMRKLRERLRTVEEEADHLREEIADIQAELHRLVDGDPT